MALQAIQHRWRTIEPKTVVAAALLLLMGIMWVRVFFSSGKPAQAVAYSETNQTQEVKAEPAIHIEPVPLPVIAGRNDRLTKDYFAVALWPQQRSSMPQDVQASLRNDAEQQRHDFINTLSSRLSIDAVLMPTGQEPAKVCLNGKVLAEGQALTLKDKDQTYELTITQIKPNAITIVCDQKTIVLPFGDQEFDQSDN